MNRILLIVISLFTVSLSFAQVSGFRGVVADKSTNEFLTGSSVTISSNSGSLRKSTAVGLDGSFSFNDLPAGSYKVVIEYVGYDVLTQSITLPSAEVRFQLQPQYRGIDEVTINGASRGTDVDARRIERLSPNVMNVISAKQIELSPDITVANVIQRVSGLSIERNASGDPQYAIVRGMDKRYNNTLVNGIKIPSPDNENRFVPLDIFPAVFLERLEVYKSLTANMEADAIGGTVNMVMKSAPSRRLFDGDFQIGYNHMNFNNDFATYDRSQLNKLSPKELFGDTYRAVPADFPAENMMMKMGRALPDVLANASYGDRFFDSKLGLMLGGSFQNSYRPVSNYFYDPEATRLEGNPLDPKALIERNTYSQQQRMALHGKLDYVMNANHKFNLYTGKYMLNEFRIRDQRRREVFVSDYDFAVYPMTRFTNVFQDITTVDLRGEHVISSLLSIDWSSIYSVAKNDSPDDGVFARSASYSSEKGLFDESVYFQGTRNSRVWERNKDKDMSFYLNFQYHPKWINDYTEVRFGGVGRHKTRDNYFNSYSYTTILGQFRGVDWTDFSNVAWESMANPIGSGGASNLVYDAIENVYAGYINTSFTINATKIQAGVRAEHTVQSYELNPIAVSSTDLKSSDEQIYLTWFPSLSLKQLIDERMNVKASYFKGISRPGFYEIVPTIRTNGGGDSFFTERGNADLRPAVGHNADLRYEYFPSALDQILAGIFYKKIIDPIEYGFPQVIEGEAPKTGTILPQNFDDATNIGLEVDYTKYFNRFGVRTNYTYTNSNIKTNKVIQQQDGSYKVVEQKRALQGQSAHIANLSLLWKDLVRKLDAQVVLNYTGRRIAVVSPYFEADHIMAPMTQLDLSVEKGFRNRLVLFAKVNNILNTPYQLYIDRPLSVPGGYYPYQTEPHERTYVRRDVYGQSYRIGMRYSLK